METTDRSTASRTRVARRQDRKLKVVEEQIDAQQIAILPADVGPLEFYAKTGSIPKVGPRRALTRRSPSKNALTDTQRQIEERRRQINEITTEQTRIRENMKTVDRNSEYYGRLLKKLNDQETTIEKLQSEIEDLTKTQNTQRHDLETYLQNTTTEDK